MKRPLASGLIIVVAGAAGLMWYQGAMDSNRQSARVATEAAMDDVAFFETPKWAVEKIKVMLTEEDWGSLARYYDLSGSDIDRSSLVSGEFFIRSERPEAAHPGEFWRYKHPFSPSFDYSFSSPTDEDGIVIVQVGITIDQGAGSPPQEGIQNFRMRESASGYQVLPD